MTHRHCPAVDCGAVIAPEHAFCRDHWQRLNHHHKQAIWREFRYARGSRAHVQAILRAALWLADRDREAGRGGAS